MNCFAGGVFLAMAFIHILPEAVEQYYAAMTGEEDEHGGHRLLQVKATIVPTANSTIAVVEEEHVDRHGIFPVPYLLFFVGYCLVLLVDRVFAGEYGHSHSHGHNDHNHHETDEKAHIDNEKQNIKMSAPPGGEGPIIQVEDFQDDPQISPTKGDNSPPAQLLKKNEEIVASTAGTPSPSGENQVSDEN